MPAHWVFFMAYAWGHLRPESNLAATLARKYPDVTISCIVDAGFVAKAQGEMTRNAKLANAESCLSRIRLIAIGNAMEGMTLEKAINLPNADPREEGAAVKPKDLERTLEVMDAMMACEAFTDYLGKTWTAEGVGRPNFVISDMMMGAITPRIKRKYGLPMWMWYVGCAGSFTRYFGPNEVGGRGPGFVQECLAIEADPERAKGRPYTRIAHDLWAAWPKTEDNIIRVKGWPPFYAWEDVPQMTWLPSFYDSVAVGMDLVETADAIMLPTVVDIEAEAVEGVADWFSGPAGRKVLCLGPQLPVDFFTSSTEKNSNTLAGTEVRFDYRYKTQHDAEAVDPCIAFLNSSLEKYGPHSALYISFGTTFYPKPEHVVILLQRLLGLEKPMPFIFAAASPFAQLPEALLAQIKESGRGLIVPWAPQQAILGHEGLGWIVSHCGGGGTFESLTQGVPVIAWPFTCDQPHHALWMSEVLDTAFELLQVRNGPVKGKAYRGGPEGTEIPGTNEAVAKEMDEVLAAAQGEEGARKRANAQIVKQKIWEAHQENGSIEKYLDYFKEFATVA